jgi:multiple sugar transport system permease protein
MRILRWSLVGVYIALATLPLLWMGVTSLKHRADTTSVNARYLPSGAETVSSNESPRFPVTLDGYRSLSESEGGSSRSFWFYLANSALIGLVSTLASVLLGTACAYGFSRYPIKGSKDWLFFILSTRFMPPLAVVVPIVLMYGQLGLRDTQLGLIILYAGFNLSLAVWLMKGFIDEIPRAYEEAALVDGYSRTAAFLRIIVPQARGGMAVTAVFCLISAWNEYGFAMTLTNSRATTVPVFFAGLQGNISGIPWPQICAGALLFVTPIVLFTVLVRKHLLRGMTFGTIKQ